MMYLLFKYKGWEPSKYYWFPSGEKCIVNAFMRQEIEDKIKESEGGGM